MQVYTCGVKLAPKMSRFSVLERREAVAFKVADVKRLLSEADWKRSTRRPMAGASGELRTAARR